MIEDNTADSDYGQLVLCPLCGSDEGYTLSMGESYRWWDVACRGCGRKLDECRADLNGGSLALPPLRHPTADEAWNRAGAYAEGLRRQIAALELLAQDVLLIDVHGALPDGSGVNDPTALWAEDWTRKLTVARFSE